MDPQQDDLPTQGPSGRAPLSWTKLGYWLPGCLVVGVLVGGAAAAAQTYFAPFIFFPLLVGVLLGALITGLARLGQTAHRGTVLAGTLLAVVATVAAEHYVSYWQACQAVNSNRLRAKELFPDKAQQIDLAQPPATFLEYLRREVQAGRPLLGNFVVRGLSAWLTWALDGALVLAAALAMVLPALRQPYCTQCQSWYRTTRSGRLAPADARQLATVAHATVPDRAGRFRYRLLGCTAGCGPTGLEISWKEPGEGLRWSLVWLDRPQRNRVVDVLDAARVARGRSAKPDDA